MQHHDPLIHVWDSRCAVARWVQTERGTILGQHGFTVQVATNWEQLEEEARDAVFATGGAPTISGISPCPPELAAQAQYTEDTDDAQPNSP